MTGYLYILYLLLEVAFVFCMKFQLGVGGECLLAFRLFWCRVLVMDCS